MAGGFPVATALNKNVKNKALLVVGAPEPVLLAGDGDDDLVQVPFVAAARNSATNTVGEITPQFVMLS